METKTKIILPSSVDLKTNGLLVLKEHGKELIESDTYEKLQKLPFKPEVLNWSGGKAFASKWKKIIYTVFTTIFVGGIALLSQGILNIDGMFGIQFFNIIFTTLAILSVSFRGRLNEEISAQQYEGIRLVCIYHKPTLEFVSAQMKKNGLLTEKDLHYIDFFNRHGLAEELSTLEGQIVERQKIRQITANLM